MSSVEALARALGGCVPEDVVTRSLSVDGFTYPGGAMRRCRTHRTAWHQCQSAAAAERILANPGPLLAALPDEAIEAECIRRSHPQQHVLGPDPQWQEGQR